MLQLIKVDEEPQVSSNDETLGSADPVVQLSRFGTIKKILDDQEYVAVDFEGNPYPSALKARIGRYFHLSELKMAIENKLDCRIEFIDGDIRLPVVTNIFFALTDTDVPLIIKARKLVLEADQELIIKTQNCSTVYSSQYGQVMTKARYVYSQAEKCQKIVGATISFN
ncbi:hypothetical protein M9194_18800 [Vibrio sp. S4M6]|uniref:hypothetical protein n=1 Tax=Vibrio sinus TaxID=2946865 RepID=UPI00202A411C|nr:hypothetical protein [Vibrio sinus]MCL9783480.1 hypothetical protein [Vibrio sinus]